jgi:hypothetical protein
MAVTPHANPQDSAHWLRTLFDNGITLRARATWSPTILPTPAKWLTHVLLYAYGRQKNIRILSRNPLALADYRCILHVYRRWEQEQQENQMNATESKTDTAALAELRAAWLRADDEAEAMAVAAKMTGNWKSAYSANERARVAMRAYQAAYQKTK